MVLHLHIGGQEFRRIEQGGFRNDHFYESVIRKGWMQVGRGEFGEADTCLHRRVLVGEALW